jgi:hypothetical protein
MGFDKKLSKQRCAGETEDLAVTNRYCPDSTCTVIYLSSKSSRKDWGEENGWGIWFALELLRLR